LQPGRERDGDVEAVGGRDKQVDEIALSFLDDAYSWVVAGGAEKPADQTTGYRELRE
jgi:hypothetical protein